MATFAFTGQFQYKTLQEGAACDAWLTAWRVVHALEITSATQNLLTSNIQDDDQGCVCELDFTLSFDTQVTNAQDTYRGEIRAALYDGTVGVADCNSGFDA